jgi:hypothetical protein
MVGTTGGADAESFERDGSVGYAFFGSMMQPNPSSYRSFRVVGAWLCLAAAVLLWMPMLAAAWSAHVMACCDGKMCAAQGHSHGKLAQQRAANETDAPMDCGHSQNGSLTSCAMSCCHEQEQVSSQGMVFVIPEVAGQNVCFTTDPSVRLADVKQIAVLFGPLSPPPRNSSSIA